MIYSRTVPVPYSGGAFRQMVRPDGCPTCRTIWNVLNSRRMTRGPACASTTAGGRPTPDRSEGGDTKYSERFGWQRFGSRGLRYGEFDTATLRYRGGGGSSHAAQFGSEVDGRQQKQSHTKEARCECQLEAICEEQSEEDPIAASSSWAEAGARPPLVEIVLSAGSLAQFACNHVHSASALRDKRARLHVFSRLTTNSENSALLWEQFPHLSVPCSAVGL